MKNLSVIIKKEALVKVALLYPNKLKIAAANLGYLTIYDILNSRKDTLCELFAMDDKYISKSYNSGKSISEFDVIAVSMSFEMDIFNLVRFLKFNKIPAHGENRNRFHPMIIGGGAYFTLNPEAIADIFDAILIGEGEEAIGEFITAYTESRDKEEVKKRLVDVEGFYIPERYKIEYEGVYVKSLKGSPPYIKKRVFSDINGYIPSSSDNIPESSFKDTFLIEVSRGCPYQCAFCSTPSLYFPYRYRDVNKVLSRSNRPWNYKKIGFVGSAISDYPFLKQLIRNTNIKTVTLSSFRINKIDEETITLLQSRGLQTVTIASEAGNERMWNKIGKGITKDMVYGAVSTLEKCGIRRLKIYFIIGFHFETDEDVYDIAVLLNDITKIYSGHITASVNVFIPKPQSVLQWAALAEKKTIKRRVAILRKYVNKSVKIDLLSYKTAVLETIFSRGNRELNRYILDSEDDNIFRLMNKDRDYFEKFTGQLNMRRTLPWDFIMGGIDKEKLKKRYLNI